MPIHRKLLISGIALLIAPICIFSISNTLSECVGQYVFPGLVLNVLNSFFSFVTAGVLSIILIILVPVGFVLCLASYAIYRSGKDISKLSVFGEVIGVVVLATILLSMFLASLNVSRYKGPNAQMMSSMSQMRAQAQLHYDANNRSYEDFCTTEYVQQSADHMRQLYANQKGVLCKADRVVFACNDSEDSYMAISKLPQSYDVSTYFCIDSGGFAGHVSTSSVDQLRCSSGDEDQY